VSDGHETWLKQIDAELDGELSLVERAALAKHLATCSHCAGARASQLEVRVAVARSAGDPHARVVPRPTIRGRALAFWAVVALALGITAGWLARGRWGAPGAGGSLEDTRAAIVVH
jgi:anti-sigma factor RsiW